MSAPDTITYQGREYVRVAGAGTPEELRQQSIVLHELAQQLRPSIASSDIAGELSSIREALTNMVRANNFLLGESHLLPNSVPGNSERIFALATAAADEVTNLGDRLQKLAARLGTWALKIDELVKEKAAREDVPTKVVKQQESKQFSHLW